MGEKNNKTLLFFELLGDVFLYYLGILNDLCKKRVPRGARGDGELMKMVGWVGFLLQYVSSVVELSL